VGPLWGRNPKATPITVRDLWIVLDLSRSMLAEDRPPLNRIERAQRHLRSLVGTLRAEGGYRVGLIVFAGKAKVVCPLTDDYSHFDGALMLASPQALDSRLRLVDGPDGAAQGTSIAGALALAGNLIDPELSGFQDVLLASDGDDLAGGWERELARLVQANVRVHCLGVGDAQDDALIPTGRPDQPFVLEVGGNQKATTRRRDDLLAKVAERGQGVFVREESGSRPLVDWHDATLAKAPRYAWDGDRRLLSAHQYGWFFGVGVVSWSLAWAWSVLARRSP
jgi:Ca-activated chloride channel family protein